MQAAAAAAFVLHLCLDLKCILEFQFKTQHLLQFILHPRINDQHSSTRYLTETIYIT